MTPNRVLELAVEDDAAPWSRRDGTGYANDVVRAAFAAEHIEVHLQVVPYARCKRLVTSGALPGCLSMSREPGLDSTVYFPDIPIFTCKVDFFESAVHPVPRGRVAALRHGAVVGVVLGYEYSDTTRAMVKRGDIVLEWSPSESINLRKLSSGRLDAAIVTHDDVKSIDYVAAGAGVKTPLRVVARGGVVPAYVGFSRLHRDGAYALDRFNRGMRTITANGMLAEIEHKWQRKVIDELRGRRTTPAMAAGRP